MKRGKGFFYRGWRRSLRPLSRSNRERILQKWNEFAITTTRKPPPHHLPLFFLGFWGELTTFFLAFLYIDEEVPSCSSRNEGKGPPEPEFTGEGTKSRFFPLGAKSLQKRRRRPQTHPELENEIKNKFFNRNASTKLPFHIVKNN